MTTKTNGGGEEFSLRSLAEPTSGKLFSIVAAIGTVWCLVITENIIYPPKSGPFFLTRNITKHYEYHGKFNTKY